MSENVEITTYQVRIPNVRHLSQLCFMLPKHNEDN